MSNGNLFALRGEMTPRQNVILGIVGVGAMLIAWQLIAMFSGVSPGIFPPLTQVVFSFKELHFEDALVRNAGYSLYLNVVGMLEAIALALPLGFIIGLLPIARGLTERQIAVLRYLPLTLLVGVFIIAFGLYDAMKINFLALGIFVYLLPTVIQRVDEVEEVYVQTAKTIGASRWQLFRIVFWPAVVSRVFDDIRVLAPISWTYIVIAELLNNTGGLGSLAYLASRQSRADKAYAILFLIIVIGVLLDRLMRGLDRLFFPFKYVVKGR